MKLLQHYRILVVFLILIGGVFRFYNLSWGAPYFFHPDERNIASAVTTIDLPHQLNPHFFAYGSLPIYSIYCIGVIQNIVTSLRQSSQIITTVSFEDAVIISRLLSAVFSLLLIPLVFSIGTRVVDRKMGLLAAFFVTTTVGFIQYAHFGTFEMWLTFFTTFLFLQCLKIVTTGSLPHLCIAYMLVGILLAIKISSVVLLPFPIIALSIFLHTSHVSYRYYAQKIVLHTLLLFLIVSSIFFITNPYAVFDYDSFRHSINYESAVALGTFPVFYTGSFYNTTPLLFHALYIYPFLLNPLLLLLGLPAVCLVVYRMIKQRNGLFFLLFLFFAITFFSQAFFFVKWTRYVIPTLPFLLLSISYALVKPPTFIANRFPLKPVLSILYVFCFVFSLSFFITVYTRPDTRLSAAEWAQQSIPPTATIASEPFDIGIIAFSFPNIHLLPLYELDNTMSAKTMQQEARNYSYIILPSQRLLKTRLQNKKQFPQGHAFYQSLHTGSLGYKMIYQTPCDIFCHIAYFGNPTYYFEETITVFDRPTVTLYQNIK